MISTKGKRKVTFQNQNYYWCIKKNEAYSPQIHISSEDKKLQLEYGFDREIAIDNTYIKGLLSRHFDKVFLSHENREMD